MSRTGYLVVGALIFALAAAGVLVWTNYLELPGTPPPTTQQTVKSRPVGQDWMQHMSQVAASGGFVATFSAADAEKWMVSDGHRLERFSLNGSDTILARLSSANALVPPARLDGLYIELPRDFAATFNGRKIEIGIVARSAKSNPAASFAVVYFTRKMGNTGWLTFKLASEFELKALEYDVPAVPEGYPDGPVVAIYADPSGGDRGVELLGLYVKAKQ